MKQQTIAVPSRVICPYCHDEIRPGDTEAKELCDSCLSIHHASCWNAHGSCAACHLGQLENRSYSEIRSHAKQTEFPRPLLDSQFLVEDSAASQLWQLREHCTGEPVHWLAKIYDKLSLLCQVVSTVSAVFTFSQLLLLAIVPFDLTVFAIGTAGVMFLLPADFFRYWAKSERHSKLRFCKTGLIFYLASRSRKQKRVQVSNKQLNRIKITNSDKGPLRVRVGRNAEFDLFEGLKKEEREWFVLQFSQYTLNANKAN